MRKLLKNLNLFILGGISTGALISSIIYFISGDTPKGLLGVVIFLVTLSLVSVVDTKLREVK